MYAALAFILISGILALVGSLKVGKKGRVLLFVAGTFAVFSMVSFAGGLESYITVGTWPFRYVGFPHVFSIRGNRLAYLSFGFWTALASAISAFIASLRHRLSPSKQ